MHTAVRAWVPPAAHLWDPAPESPVWETRFLPFYGEGKGRCGDAFHFGFTQREMSRAGRGPGSRETAAVPSWCLPSTDLCSRGRWGRGGYQGQV